MKHFGYFVYLHEQYYLYQLSDSYAFLNVYHYYQYIIHKCHLPGYVIIKNNQNDWFSNNCVLLKYISKVFSYEIYLENFLMPIPLTKIAISDIKEQWIHKIDQTAKNIAAYDENSKVYIYYYLGMAENSIEILNYLLQINKYASLPLCLSLVSPINNDVLELLNPCNYMISSRMRHLMILMQSELLTLKQLSHILDNQFYDVYEIIYLYAHSLYPGHFFDDILNNRNIYSYFQNIHSQNLFLLGIYKTLSLYVSLPKIHWINDENML